MAEIRAEGLPLCDSADLAERGPAWIFDVLLYGEPVRAFALRFDGTVVAYINRCVHVPTELDWVAGQFLDREQRVIVCATHGAEYDPLGGRCLGGPCGRGRLTPVEVREGGGRVTWYPSRDIRPVPFDPSDPPDPGSPR